MPLKQIRKLSLDTQIGIWEVEESIEQLRNYLKLNEEELAFFERLNKNKRNLHWLSSRALIRKLLNTDHFIEMKGDEYGKPHLINFEHELSISHSSAYAAVVLSKNRCGIDIERMQKKILRIAPRFLSKQELKETSNAEIEKYYVYWGAKESMYKLYGKKRVNFANEMSLAPFDMKESGVVKGKLSKADEHLELNIYYAVIDDYLLSYTIEGMPEEELGDNNAL